MWGAGCLRCWDEGSWRVKGQVFDIAAQKGSGLRICYAQLRIILHLDGLLKRVKLQPDPTPFCPAAATAVFH